MASCITTQWSNAYTPQVQLTVTQSSETATTATLSWTLQFVAHGYAVSGAPTKSYSVTIDGASVSTGTFNMNGITGTSTIASGTKTVNKSSSARNVAFSTTFDFSGIYWGGKAGSSLTASSSISISAITKYTLTLITTTGVASFTGGGSFTAGSTPSTTCTASTGYTLSKYAGNKSDGSADGSWNITSGTTDTTTWTMNANRTITAYATANKYTVTLNGNGATSSGTTSVSATYNAAMPSITKPSRAYKVTFNPNFDGAASTDATATYTFNGYYSATSGGTQYYKADGSSARNYTTAKASTLYAQWTSKSVTLPILSRKGYKFLGWATTKTATTATYVGGSAYTPTATTILYAVWERSEYVYVKENGTWVPCNIYIKESGNWNESAIYYKQDGTWIQ